MAANTVYGKNSGTNVSTILEYHIKTTRSPFYNLIFIIIRYNS